MTATDTTAPATSQRQPSGAVPPTQSLLRSAASLPEMRWAAAATALFAVGGLLQLAGAADWTWWALYLACYACGGWEPALAGLQALRQRTLDVDLLMIVAALVAAGIGQVFDGALLIVIFATSGALEALATRRTEDSVAALLDLTPERATRLGGDGGEEVVDAAGLHVGDRILVRPGERIGADGRVADGISDVDQASITGEPLPVLKQPGSEVFAGTLNGTGALTVTVTRDPSQSVVARIVALVEEASATKAKTQLFVERVEQRYSVGVVVATLALFAIPLLFGADFDATLLRAMTFMIVASPCAVVLATMPPLLAVIANAGRHGVLVKSAVALEELGRTGLVAFDKTGTLTHGVPRVATVVAAGDRTEAEVLRLAAAVEQRSEHPVAAAIVAAARASAAGSPGLPEVADFTSTPGRGVGGTVGRVRVEVGSPALLRACSVDVAALAASLSGLEEAGCTVVVVTADGEPAGLVAVTDEVRAEAAGAVAALGALTGSAPVLLTGDNRAAATRLAEAVGIRDVRAQLLPEDKVAAVRELGADDSATRGRQVMLVGDGVNDAPAMAAAHTGVAMGRNGSDLALETADVVLVRDDLAALPKTIALARRAHRVVKANLVIAGSVIAVLVVWDVLGTLPLPLGVAGHEGSTIVVALNGLRLLRRSAWKRAATLEGAR